MLPTIATGNVASALAGEYEVANSLRFNKADAPKLERTFGTATNRKIWTLSMWVKRSSTNQAMLLSTNGAASYYQFQSGGAFEINDIPVSTYNYRLVTNAIYRDISAWMHIVIAFDSTQSTASDRLKLYINGEQPSLSVATYPSLNFEPRVNNAEAIKFGSYDGSTDFALDGYLCEIAFVDGSQLDASSFGEFDSDSSIWKPKDVSGLTFGNNGFYLDFENSGSLGADVSGNGNNFTVNNLTSVDQSTDTCTNNFATFNPLIASNDPVTYSDGNCKIASAGTNGTGNSYFGGASTFMVSQGKWYCEFKYSVKETLPRLGYGISYDPQEAARSNDTATGGSARNVIYDCQSGDVVNSGTTISGYGNTWDQGDIIGIALDLDNDKLYFSKNGTWQNSGDPESGSTGTGAVSITTGKTWSFIILDNNNDLSQTTETNFGNPTFSISSGNSDGNGYGQFEYQPPSGYLALCTKNLATDG